MSTGATAPGRVKTDLAGQGRNLALATFAFTATFWAWNLIVPLAVRYTAAMSLSGPQKALMVATPVLVGSIGRIPVGALTDRFGGRVMFPILTLATVPFVVLVALAGEADSYPLLLLFGFFLGIAGTTFAVGIPFVNAWYQADRRGFATGVFGAGMGGTALSSALLPGWSSTSDTSRRTSSLRSRSWPWRLSAGSACATHRRGHPTPRP